MGRRDTITSSHKDSNGSWKDRGICMTVITIGSIACSVVGALHIQIDVIDECVLSNHSMTNKSVT